MFPLHLTYLIHYVLFNLQSNVNQQTLNIFILFYFIYNNLLNVVYFYHGHFLVYLLFILINQYTWNYLPNILVILIILIYLYLIFIINMLLFFYYQFIYYIYDHLLTYLVYILCYLIIISLFYSLHLYLNIY